MATDYQAKILRQLESISGDLGDLNAIRNGEFDPPLGASATAREPKFKSPNDLHAELVQIREEAQEQTAILRDILEAIRNEG